MFESGKDPLNQILQFSNSDSQMCLKTSPFWAEFYPFFFISKIHSEGFKNYSQSLVSTYYYFLSTNFLLLTSSYLLVPTCTYVSLCMQPALFIYMRPDNYLDKCKPNSNRSTGHRSTDGEQNSQLHNKPTT